MASPDKESQFIVLGGAGVVAESPTLEEAEAKARLMAKEKPGFIFTVYRAVSDFQAGEVPVERTAYRQAASRKAE